ncbi:MAG: pyridoxamine 5'-phosphate oxidase [Nocardioidaceae bacterium]
MTAELPRDIAAWRKEYEDRGLVESDLGDDPIAAFSTWLDAAQRAGLHEANAMVVSTVDPAGAPSSRMVLLKTVDSRGFVFYTNYHSRKGADLQANDRCALLFPWHPLERQVRVEGTAHEVDAAESDAYFSTRPLGAQIGAWASPQSKVVTGREFLAERYVQESDRLATADIVPRPSHWGGYLVRPYRIEFWQGRPGRMHDRIRFDRADEATWVVERLAP